MWVWSDFMLLESVIGGWHSQAVTSLTSSVSSSSLSWPGHGPVCTRAGGHLLAALQKSRHLRSSCCLCLPGEPLGWVCLRHSRLAEPFYMLDSSHFLWLSSLWFLAHVFIFYLFLLFLGGDSFISTGWPHTASTAKEGFELWASYFHLLNAEIIGVYYRT